MGHGPAPITHTWRAASSCCARDCRSPTSASWSPKARRTSSGRPPRRSAATRPDPPGLHFDGCAPETLLAAASVKDGRIVSAGRDELPRAGPAGAGDDDAGAAQEGQGPRRRRRDRDRAAAAEIARALRISRMRRGGRAAGRRGLGRLRRDERSRTTRSASAASSGCVSASGPARPPRPILFLRSRRALFRRRHRKTAIPGALAPRPSMNPGSTAISPSSPWCSIKMAVAPDFSSDVPLRWTHRRAGATEIYFVANPEPRAVGATAVFRVSGLRPELWDPLEGTNRGAGGITPLRRPNLRSAALRALPIVLHCLSQLRRSPQDEPAPAFRCELPGPRRDRLSRGPRDIAFDPKQGGPEKIIFEPLEDWSAGLSPALNTMRGWPSTPRPSTFQGHRGAQPERWWLDLGTVKNMARVRLNGRELGIVWCAPWRVDVTGTVRAKGNQLEITVVNLSPNRLIGDEQLAPDCEYGKDGEPGPLARLADQGRAAAVDLGRLSIFHLEAVYEGLAAFFRRASSVP